MTYDVKTYTVIGHDKTDKVSYDGSSFCMGTTCYTFSIEYNLTWEESEKTCQKKTKGRLWSLSTSYDYHKVLVAGAGSSRLPHE